MIIKNKAKFQIDFKKLVHSSLFFIFFILISGALLNLNFIKINLLKQKIAFEPSGSFHDQPIKLTLNSPIKKAKIYYTFDGSTPTQKSFEYQKPIDVSQTTTLKFVLYRKNKLIGPVQTHDVFIDSNHELAVISLSTQPKNLWDEEIGIYTQENAVEKGKEWEREAVLNFYEEDGSLGFSREIGLRIHGGGSRSLPQKSFRVFMTHQKGGQTLKYPLFPENEITTFDSFILRNAGGDWNYAHMRDALMHELIEDSDLNVDLQDYRPAVVYLNGEYWGLYNMRERHNEYYFANKYGANLDRVNIYNVPHDVGEKRGKIELDEGDDKGGVKLYNKLFEETRRCKGCVTLDYLSQYLDLINYRDYLITEFHFGNYDWPYGNSKAWRYGTNTYDEDAPYGLDGRFRWLVFDLDVGFGKGEETPEGMKKSAQGNSYGRLIDDAFPFRNLFYDNAFRIGYINKYADLLNTSFKYEKVVSKIDEMAAAIDSEMPRQIEKWHQKETWSDLIKDEKFIEETKNIESYEEWKHQIELLKVRARWRPEYMKENTVNFFDLSGLRELTVDINNPTAGKIKINTITIGGEQMPWSGDYFNDTRFSVEAIPQPGYEFVRWEGDIESKKPLQSVVLSSSLQLEAIFKQSFFFRTFGLK